MTTYITSTINNGLLLITAVVAVGSEEGAKGLTREMAAEREKKTFAIHGTSLSAVATAFAHPLTYVKVLVQVVPLHLTSQ